MENIALAINLLCAIIKICLLLVLDTKKPNQTKTENPALKNQEQFAYLQENFSFLINGWQTLTIKDQTVNT